jgi:hypothetical protein
MALKFTKPPPPLNHCIVTKQEKIRECGASHQIGNQ